MKNNFEEQQYSVSGRKGYSLSLALRLWKTKYEDLKQFKAAVCNHPNLEEFYNFVAEIWDSIKPVTVKEALAVKNTEDRRTYFDCLGPQKLFKEMNAELLDKQVVKKKRARWDDKNVQYEYEFEDVYELYRIPGDQMFERPAESWRRNEDVFTVRCWCTTTNREYWLFVPENAACESMWRSGECKITWDAIKAIAWTIRLSITHPEKIYRQGDIIVAKASEESSETRFARHLTKEDYLELMYSET